MNWRFTFVLVVVFCVLLAVAYAVREAEPFDVGQGPPTTTPGPLAVIASSDLQEVTVVGATGSYTLTKVYGGWEVDGQEATNSVDDAMAELVKLEIERSVPAGKNPEDYGFATPTMTVTLKTEAGQSYVLHVGDEVPGEAAYFVQLEGNDGIYFMNNAQLSQMNDWLTDKPIQPTRTPTWTSTPAGTPEASGTLTPVPLGSEAAGPPGPLGTEAPAAPTLIVTVPAPLPTATSTP
jgi:hypothetical protein